MNIHSLSLFMKALETLYGHVASLLCRHSEIHTFNLIEMLCVCLISLISSGLLHLIIVRLWHKNI